jgi:hypothetical protein
MRLPTVTRGFTGNFKGQAFLRAEEPAPESSATNASTPLLLALFRGTVQQKVSCLSVV